MFNALLPLDRLLLISLLPGDHVLVVDPAGVHHVNGRGGRVPVHADGDARDSPPWRHAAQCLMKKNLLFNLNFLSQPHFSRSCKVLTCKLFF